MSTTTTSAAAVDECAVSSDVGYDLGLHIGALFIIMGCSLLGTTLPIIASKVQLFQLMGREGLLLSCGKMFGAGVILATSLVHMLGPAMENLSNPCLPAVFQDYTFAPAICLFAILSLQLIQFLVSKEIRRHHNKAIDTAVKEVLELKDAEKGEQQQQQQQHQHHHDHAHGEEGHAHGHDDGHTHGHELILRKEQHVSTYILEVGIASHSIIIGVALGVARDPEFHSLIVALVFHQFFEGMALSTVVLDSKFKRSLPAIIMVVFYTLTTPLGISIGIGINSSFNANSVDNLIAQGVLDSLSAGILLYDAIVNILTVHFKSPKFVEASNFAQAAQFITLWFGTAAMALIGRWA